MMGVEERWKGLYWIDIDEPAWVLGYNRTQFCQSGPSGRDFGS